MRPGLRAWEASFVVAQPQELAKAPNRVRRFPHVEGNYATSVFIPGEDCGLSYSLILLQFTEMVWLPVVVFQLSFHTTSFQFSRPSVKRCRELLFPFDSLGTLWCWASIVGLQLSMSLPNIELLGGDQISSCSQGSASRANSGAGGMFHISLSRVVAIRFPDIEMLIDSLKRNLLGIDLDR